MLRQMYEVRAFEEQAEKSYMMGKIHGTMHLSIGQEASAVGSISTLEPDDFILIPNPRTCDPGKAYKVVFKAKRL